MTVIMAAVSYHHCCEVRSCKFPPAEPFHFPISILLISLLGFSTNAYP